MYTIDEAKAALRTNFDRGMKCPCCQQMVKRYKRKLTSGMAIGLINLYKQSASGFVHISKLGRLNGGEFAQLIRWGLIDEEPSADRDAKRTSGRWRITSKGIQFIMGRLSVAGHVYTYNGETLGFSTDRTTITEALGNKFNYSEIMNGVAMPPPINLAPESEEFQAGLYLFPN